MKDQPYCLVVAQSVHIDINTLVIGRLPHQGRIDTPTIIGQGNDVVGSFFIHIDTDRTRSGFALLPALTGGLDAVIHCVANHVLQNYLTARVVIPVQCSHLIEYFKRNRFTQIGSHRTHDSSQSGEQSRYGNYPGLLYR